MLTLLADALLIALRVAPPRPSHLRFPPDRHADNPGGPKPWAGRPRWSDLRHWLR